MAISFQSPLPPHPISTEGYPPNLSFETQISKIQRNTIFWEYIVYFKMTQEFFLKNSQYYVFCEQGNSAENGGEIIQNMNTFFLYSLLCDSR